MRGILSPPGTSNLLHLDAELVGRVSKVLNELLAPQSRALLAPVCLNVNPRAVNQLRRYELSRVAAEVRTLAATQLQDLLEAPPVQSGKDSTQPREYLVPLPYLVPLLLECK